MKSSSQQLCLQSKERAEPRWWPGVAGLPQSRPSWPGISGCARSASPARRQGRPECTLSTCRQQLGHPLVGQGAVGPAQRASTCCGSASGPARVSSLCFPEHPHSGKQPLFPGESYFLVKFPASRNQELPLFPSRGCFPQQSNTVCKACDKYGFNTDGVPGNYFLPVHAKLCRSRWSFFFCHIFKASVWAITAKDTPVTKYYSRNKEVLLPFTRCLSSIIRVCSVMEPD